MVLLADAVSSYFTYEKPSQPAASRDAERGHLANGNERIRRSG